MAGNTIGRLFTVTTFGESHGIALGAIVDGVPPGIELTEADLQFDLDRRRPGSSKYTTKRQELDQVQIMSGVFEGKTTGTPIGLVIHNTDQRSQDYGNIAQIFRPSHADYTYHHKYGIRDYRGGGRSSARETAMRVAAGAIAKKILMQYCNLQITGFVSQIGEHHASYDIYNLDYDFINNNAFFTTDQNSIDVYDKLIRNIRKQGDSIGAQVKIVATNVPLGLGAPIFDRLDADIAHAMMSINAVKAVEIGDGMGVINQKGSEHRDQITKQDGFLTNHAGGILGGISNGDAITVSIGLKPTSSIEIPGKTIDSNGEDAQIITKGRHDPCVGIRSVPIAEAMLAIVLLDHLMQHKAQCTLFNAVN